MATTEIVSIITPGGVGNLLSSSNEQLPSARDSNVDRTRETHVGADLREDSIGDGVCCDSTRGRATSFTDGVEVVSADGLPGRCWEAVVRA